MNVNSDQQIAGAVGIGLIAANFWTSKERTIVTAGLFGTGDKAAAHTELRQVGMQLLFVAAAVLLAGISGTAGKAAIAVLVALAILWAINHYAPNKGN